MVSRVRQSVLSAAILVLLAGSSPAQRPPRWGGEFFEALRETSLSHANRDLLNLLYYPPVRDEVGLDEEEFGEFKALMDRGMKVIRSIHEASADKTKEQIKGELEEKLNPLHRETTEWLEESVDTDRLLALFVQSSGNSAATADKVAAKIGIDDEQLKKLRRKRSELHHQMKDRARKEIERLVRNNRGNSWPDVSESFRRAHEWFDAKLGEQLTAEQRSKLKELEGEAFDDLPPPGFMPYRGGRGRGDRGGPPGNGPPPGPPPGQQNDHRRDRDRKEERHSGEKSGQKDQRDQFDLPLASCFDDFRDCTDRFSGCGVNCDHESDQRECHARTTCDDDCPLSFTSPAS